MRFTFRKRLDLLPFLRLNVSKSGTSHTWHLGRWSWNSRTRRHSVDLPGPVTVQSDARRRRR